MAAAADKAFTGYRPLDKARREIRLLRLKAGYGEDTVRCEITHASLDDAALASYETISYVWGDPSIRTIIEIDGSRVLEPKTAAAALTRMRLEDEDRTLWIDAICIDQSNKPERSHQVNMMAEIYTRGTRCLAYLRSESRNQGESAASAIRVLRKHAMAEANVLDLTVHGAGSKDGQLGPLIVECAKDAIDAFCDVLKGPWFR
ncbi:hypothetical protein B0A48_03281 [Cryoendolithus antarcticus]|uniref:Heterokaryon incompatibility domain-containing protein n=1 Tax=Cryoendolithus antarcticus TaxID=1507870 RepID=A0A1V8TJS4_9PEZI|nr:hypothetical protein B0A48_03281 [Cryoendolithus antarcticus]